MKIIINILLILTILLTVFVGIKKPIMHQRIMVYDSQYTIVKNNETKPEPKTLSSKEIPTMPVENTLTKTQTVFEQKTTPTVNQEIKKTTESIKVTPTVVPKQKELNKTINKQIETKNTQPSTTLSQQEELIAWNKWRSNLQNQIMRDSRLPILPLGTIIKISFDVDKYGKISNVQTWSTNSKYTPYAIEYIAPVIRSYQGKSILDFPQGSKRTSTTFVGGWRISQTTKYSTPENYNDIEKVTK